MALSFAGAQRDYVEQVAGVLKARGVRCFYDADEQIELWGKYLAEELPAVYAEQAAAVVVFVSAEYAARVWTRLERRAALYRAVQEKREYVLPARFDDTSLPGLLSDMVAIDLRGRTPQQFADMIGDKLAAFGIVAPVPPTDLNTKTTIEPSAPTVPHATTRGVPQPTRILTGHTGSVWGVSFSPDGRLLATASEDETAWVWDPATGEHLRTLAGHADGVRGVAFSPDGRLLATASRDETARVWDPATGKRRRMLTGHTGSVWGVSFSPDGRLLATASVDGTAGVWDPATGQHLRTLTGHADGVWGVAFSPDGRLLATASADQTAWVWDPATGQHLRTLTGHDGRVQGVAFSPDGRLLATAGEDGKARLWDPATGEHLRTLAGHTDRVLAGGVQPGRAAARHHQRRPDGVGMGSGRRPAPAHPRRPHRRGLGRGVQPGRAAARHHQRRQDGAAVGVIRGHHSSKVLAATTVIDGRSG